MRDIALLLVVLAACLPGDVHASGDAGRTTGSVARPPEGGRFAGMAFTALTDDQLREVEKAYGEPCCVYVTSVGEGSPAAGAGVRAGDVLLSVRMPGEDEFYPIPPDVEDMAAFAAETEPVAGTRLLVLRPDGEAYRQVELLLGPAPGTTPGGEPEGAATPLRNGSDPAPLPSFTAGAPEEVVARALDGSPLTQGDVDIFGGVLAWSFGTRLTEGQKAVVRSALAEFWPQAPGEVVRMFRQGFLATPDLLPRLAGDQREAFRQGCAGLFIQMAQGMPGHPLSQVIAVVSAGARNVLAGAGTGVELTLQDAQSMLEYLVFLAQVQTGQPVAVSPDQQMAFVQQLIAYFNEASPEERRVLASMDERWAAMRAQWAAAQAAQQQALAAQWQQAYALQQAAGGYVPYASAWQGSATGGDMDQGSFDAVLNSMNTLHQSSMSTLGSIDGGYDYSVYDGAGNWLYDE